jgi:hypothetical protein
MEIEAPERSLVAPTRPNSPTNDSDTESDNEEMKVNTKKRKRDEAATPRKKQKTKTEKRQYGICGGLPWPKEWTEGDKADPCVYHITLRGKIEYVPYSGLPESTPVIFPSSVEVNSAEANVKLVKEMRKKVQLGYTARTFAYSSGYWVRFGPQDKERLDLIQKKAEKKNEKTTPQYDGLHMEIRRRRDEIHTALDNPECDVGMLEHRILALGGSDAREWSAYKAQAMKAALIRAMKEFTVNTP